MIHTHTLCVSEWPATHGAIQNCLSLPRDAMLAQYYAVVVYPSVRLSIYVRCSISAAKQDHADSVR